jgi:hypothetical protein
MGRRFINYQKKYPRVNFSKCERILKVFDALTRPSNSIIHVLTTVDIPPEVILLLNLGLKFSFSLKIDWKSIRGSFVENERKIAWRMFFLLNNLSSLLKQK